MSTSTQTASPIRLLAIAYSRSEADVWQSVLRGWRIHSFVRNMNPLAYLLGPLPYDLAYYELYILSEDYDLALDLLTPSLDSEPLQGDAVSATIFSWAWLIELLGPYIISSFSVAATGVGFRLGA